MRRNRRKSSGCFKGLISSVYHHDNIINEMMEECVESDGDDCFGILFPFSVSVPYLDEHIHNEESIYDAEDRFYDIVRSMELINYLDEPGGWFDNEMHRYRRYF